MSDKLRSEDCRDESRTRPQRPTEPYSGTATEEARTKGREDGRRPAEPLRKPLDEDGAIPDDTMDELVEESVAEAVPASLMEDSRPTASVVRLTWSELEEVDGLRFDPSVDLPMGEISFDGDQDKGERWDDDAEEAWAEVVDQDAPPLDEPEGEPTAAYASVVMEVEDPTGALSSRPAPVTGSYSTRTAPPPPPSPARVIASPPPPPAPPPSITRTQVGQPVVRPLPGMAPPGPPPRPVTQVGPPAAPRVPEPAPRVTEPTPRPATQVGPPAAPRVTEDERAGDRVAEPRETPGRTAAAAKPGPFGTAMFEAARADRPWSSDEEPEDASFVSLAAEPETPAEEPAPDVAPPEEAPENAIAPLLLTLPPVRFALLCDPGVDGQGAPATALLRRAVMHRAFKEADARVFVGRMTLDAPTAEEAWEELQARARAAGPTLALPDDVPPPEYPFARLRLAEGYVEVFTFDAEPSRLEDQGLRALDQALAEIPEGIRKVVVLAKDPQELPARNYPEARKLAQDLKTVLEARKVDLVLFPGPGASVRRKLGSVVLIGAPPSTGGCGLTGQRSFLDVRLSVLDGKVTAEPVHFAPPVKGKAAADAFSAVDDIRAVEALAKRALEAEDAFGAFAEAFEGQAARLAAIDQVSQKVDSRLADLLRRAGGRERS